MAISASAVILIATIHIKRHWYF